MGERGLNLTMLGWGLAIPVLFLTCVGLSAIHATDRSIEPTPLTNSELRGLTAPPSWIERVRTSIGDNTLRQTFFFITGVGLMFAAMKPSYRKLGRYAYWIYGFTLVLLALLVIDRYIDLPFVPVRRNVRRWISLGFAQVQPSEFIKVALILALAHYLRFRSSFRRWSGLLPPFLFTVAPMLLILKQPDLGTLLMLLPVLFAMIFVAGARLRHLAIIVAAGLALLPIFYVYGMKPYQRDRVEVVFRQNTDDRVWQKGKGYQLRQSKTALGLGGLAGAGYREGTFVRYALLPEEHNDFVFAIIGHQWGMLGGASIILAYIIIVICGLEVALVTNDPFGRLLAVGVVVMIVVQALLNICMTIGLAPITGMTLPFVSFGGSSLWTNFIALGLLVNVAQRRPMLIANKPFQHED